MNDEELVILIPFLRELVEVYFLLLENKCFQLDDVREVETWK